MNVRFWVRRLCLQPTIFAPFTAAVFVLVGSLRIVSCYPVFNHTIDEPDHLAAGMEWLSIQKYRYEDQHPPLARLFVALGPYMAGERWRSDLDPYGEGYRILGSGSHYDRILSLGRLGTLPFFWLTSLTVFLWARRASGDVAALIGTLLLTTLPPILANAGVMTTDMALTALVSSTVLASLSWVKCPSRVQSITLGVLIGLALLSKFSALLFLPAAWLLMYACVLLQTRSYEGIARWIRPALMVAGVAFVLIWAGYWFSFARVEFLHCRLPAPRFFSGIHTVWEHNVAGHASFLLGAKSSTGFWYYYPVVLAVKTPLGLLFLLGWVLWLAFYRSSYRSDILLPLAFSVGILLSALTSRINIGTRHVLPVYTGFCVIAGIFGARIWRSRGPYRLPSVIVFCAFVLWHIASGVHQHPDYLAYTNEIAGDQPENWVADSDLDWGQDMKRLGKRLGQVGATSLTFVPFNRTYIVAGHAFPTMLPGNADHPSPGWNAVSVTLWKVFGYPRWADTMRPQERVGRSILLWYFPPQPQPAQ